jgi:hypothetical protein
MLCFGGRRGSSGSYNGKKTKEFKRSEDIDKAIRAERKKEAKEVKLLLLGELIVRSQVAMCVNCTSRPR